MKPLYLKEIETPTGPIRILCGDSSIIRLLFENDNLGLAADGLQKRYSGITTDGGNPFAERCERELAEYFSGSRTEFTVKPTFHGTVYQNKVWNALLQIPFGQTVSYRGLAHLAGVGGYRAVGQAVGKNPVPIIAPCHRVIRADGSIGGFGGGLPVKKTLLRLEGILFE